MKQVANIIAIIFGIVMNYSLVVAWSTFPMQIPTIVLRILAFIMIVGIVSVGQFEKKQKLMLIVMFFGTLLVVGAYLLLPHMTFEGHQFTFAETNCWPAHVILVISMFIILNK